MKNDVFAKKMGYLLDIKKTKWILDTNSICSSNIGDIYDVKDENNNKYSAIMITSPIDRIRSISNKHSMYLKAISHGKYENCNYIITKTCRPMSTIPIVSLVYDQIVFIYKHLIEQLRLIHSVGKTHNNICMSNIFITDNKEAFLVNYDINQKPHKHLMSRGHHKNIKSKKDDLEMLYYNLLLWLGYIPPWINQKKKDNILMIKEGFIYMITLGEFSYLPKYLIDIILYIDNIKTDDNIDYNYLTKLFNS